MMKNFLLINKPAGWTSFDVVAFLRNKLRRLDPKNKKIKIGHAGTLDPFATGLLIVGVGREATKRLEEFKDLPKTYETEIQLGKNSNTDDKTGEITAVSEKIPDKKEIENILNQFTGKQLQIPPMFSAKKIAGQRLYKLARQGKTVARQPSEIEIFSIKLLDYSYPLIKIEIVCSAGTYIRTLAHDLGEKIGTGAYCAELIRTKIGPYGLASAKDVTDPGLTELLDKHSETA